ncbi:putative 3-ketosphinganine reductase [Talaromyces proteolyticus]|uniref:3-dehydrosphinganine reductase n=1 Tax=Talaromyces proteolyticus TaxID=1131652 RepID=A0AAD4KRK1_9EURO|nr:putative 3-ketosphinganine reductase [Talaromyces proteolyticus]KAH8697363.1 putative 3-ketosphinganine reductase [Talaromyces proteolyticus]
MEYFKGTTAIAVVFLGILTSIAYRMLGFGSNKFPVNGKTILITGASEGMGRSAAIQLAQKGANIVIVSRSTQKLEAAIKLIQAAAVDPSKQRFHYISADLTNPDDADRILDETTKWNNGVALDAVWCCAGYCHPGYFIDVPIQTLRDQMDTVYWTSAYTAHATLRRWLAPITSSGTNLSSPPRHLIFTASTLSFFTVTGYSPYSPPKAAIRNLSDVLVQEIEMYNGARRSKDANAPATDVKIHIVFPMGISSPGFENEQKLKPALTHIMEEADKPQTPDEVAAIAIKGLEKGDFQIITNMVGQVMRTSSLGISPRNSVFLDTVASWFTNIVCLFVISDFMGKAFNFGKKNGISSTRP